MDVVVGVVGVVVVGGGVVVVGVVVVGLGDMLLGWVVDGQLFGWVEIGGNGELHYFFAGFFCGFPLLE